ncbi:hypothetical protein BOX15_Mlig003144g1, partial [Macrostomum lignano]
AMRFEGKRFLITGCNRGIGRDLAISLAKQGAEVVALCRSGLSDLPAACPDPEARARLRPVQCDLNDWSATRSLVLSLGRFDGVVNNAGVSKNEAVGSITEENLQNLFRVNLFAAINVGQTAAESMQSGASIVNISSQASFMALPGHTAYAASKAALDSVTRSFASELGKRGIRCNSVNPGVVMTDMSRAYWSNPQVGEPMLARAPLGRFAEVPEVVSVVEFLLSDEASMVNGVVLPVEGGVSVNQL